MRALVKQFVRICSENLLIPEPIYEFGSFQVPGQEGFADVRPLFAGKEFVGADRRAGLGVDVILNLHHINLPSATVGTVLILDTLEHVEFPRKAIAEVCRILKPRGILIVTSVMNYPIHDYPHDYWRFVPSGLKSLLEPFTFSFVGSIGNPNYPHTVIGLASKGTTVDNFAGFLEQFEIREQSHNGTHEPLWKRLVRPLVPRAALPVLREIRQCKGFRKLEVNIYS